LSVSAAAAAAAVLAKDADSPLAARGPLQGNWSSTSAVCWFYAKDLYEATKIPQGIISSNWGGTIIQSWSDNATNAKCGKAGTELLGLELPAGVEAPEKFASADGYAARGGPSLNAGHASSSTR